MAATVDHRRIRPQNDVHGKEASGIVRMRKGVSHGNMQCVHACLLAPLCNLDRVFECLPVPSGKDAKRAVQVAPGEFYDERKTGVRQNLELPGLPPARTLPDSSERLRNDPFGY